MIRKLIQTEKPKAEGAAQINRSSKHKKIDLEF